jgi:hypothetical protein
LRRERRRSPRTEADAAHVAAKTEMLQLRLMEKKRELVPRADFCVVIDRIAGIVTTHLNGMAARCSSDRGGAAQDRRCGASGTQGDREGLP